MAREAPKPLEVKLFEDALDRLVDNPPRGYEKLVESASSMRNDLKGNSTESTLTPGKLAALEAQQRYSGLDNAGTDGTGAPLDAKRGPDKPSANQPGFSDPKASPNPSSVSEKRETEKQPRNAKDEATERMRQVVAQVIGAGAGKDQ